MYKKVSVKVKVNVEVKVYVSTVNTKIKHTPRHDMMTSHNQTNGMLWYGMVKFVSCSKAVVVVSLET